jgi:acetyl-CoA carboxylase biotin carboxyl carrier protein
VTSDNGTGSNQPSRSSLAELGGPDGVAELVRSLVAMMRDGGIAKLDLAVGSFSVHLRTGKNAVQPTVVSVDATATVDPNGTRPLAEHIITAPMIGTFYASPSPGSRPFVDVGDVIKAGQVVGIIEAMKIMNEIIAEQPGEVTAILASNGQAVEYGSPLILLSLGAGS